MDPNTIRVLQESNRAGVRFLRIELEMGHTFLDIADVTENESTRIRDLQNASRVYESVQRLVGRVDLSPEEEGLIQQKIAELKHRLDTTSRNPAFDPKPAFRRKPETNLGIVPGDNELTRG